MLLIRDAEVAGARVDLRVEEGVITRVGPGIEVRPEDEVVDARGGALLPGLHDHHIHLLALAASLRSVSVGPPDVTDEDGLAAALRAADHSADPGTWIRAVGYHESVAGDLDRWKLDTLVSGRPVRVQHRSGALWILNSAAAEAVGVEDAGDVEGIERDADGTATGRLWRLDRWLGERTPDHVAAGEISEASRLLLRHGVTGVTDATPTKRPGSMDLLAGALADRSLRQRLAVTGDPFLKWEVPASVTLGPAKLVLGDHRLPSFDDVVAGVRAAREAGRAVAIHAVTAAAAALAIAAIDEVGAADGDRVEHGALLSPGLAARLAEMGVTVVTNPGFVATRGDRYRVDVELADQPDLWRCRSLLDIGVSVGAGTDVPYGDPNPWVAIAAAADRRTDGGAVLGAGEAVEPLRALQLFLTPLEAPGGRPRQVAPGEPADLVLLPTPLVEALRNPRSVQPIATITAGALSLW